MSGSNLGYFRDKSNRADFVNRKVNEGKEQFAQGASRNMRPII